MAGVKKPPAEEELYPLLSKSLSQTTVKGRTLEWILQWFHGVLTVAFIFFCLFVICCIRNQNLQNTSNEIELLPLLHTETGAFSAHHTDSRTADSLWTMQGILPRGHEFLPPVKATQAGAPPAIKDSVTTGHADLPLPPVSRYEHEPIPDNPASIKLSVSDKLPEGWQCRLPTCKMAVAAVGNPPQGGCCALTLQTKKQSVVSQHPVPSLSLPQQCFSSLKCRRGLKIHIYPGKSAEWLNESSNFIFHEDEHPNMSTSVYEDKSVVKDRWDTEYSPPLRYVDVLKYIRKSRFYTAEPDDACLFMPSFLHSEFAGEKDDFAGFPADWEDRLQQLPLFSAASPSWGKQHLLWDWGDTPDRSIVHGMPGDVDCPIFVKSGFHFSKYRCGHDVSFPLLGEHTFDSFFRGADTGHHRPILVSFKGSTWGPKNKRESDSWGPQAAVRNNLRHLHNGKDIVISLECIDRFSRPWGRYDLDGVDSWCLEFKSHFDDFDWKELAVNSTFSLVPAGWGLHSKRLIEVMSAGSIPVIISDGWVLPFSEILDWNSFSIIVAESDVLRIPQILRSLEPPVVAKMREKMLRVYDAHFSSIPRAVGTLLEILEQRLVTKEEHNDISAAVDSLNRVYRSLKNKKLETETS